MPKIIEIRTGCSKSWLDRGYARVLSAQLSDRLINRCKGQQGLFLTLTYRRDDYESARDLYREASEQRHVRRFIERLSGYMGVSLTGKWLCKLEFQRGGWVHWHLIILGPNYLDHSALQNMWGRGYVWVNRITPSRIKYACKYVSKSDDLPAYLYMEPVRSVKIIRVSPGFWGETSSSGGGGSPPADFQPTKLSGCYLPIGMSIEIQANRTIVRHLDKDGIYQYEKHEKPIWQIVFQCVESGAIHDGTEDGWLRYRIPNIPKLQLQSQLQRRGHDAEQAGRVATGGRRRAFHLNNNRNPPIGMKSLNKYFGEMFECLNLIPCEGGV